MSYILHGFGIYLKNLKVKQINSNNNKTLKQPKELIGLETRKTLVQSLLLLLCGWQANSLCYLLTEDTDFWSF